MSSFVLRIITPQVSSIISDVESLHFKSISGDITILPNHYPLIVGVDVSKLLIKKNKLPILAFISDGLVSVKEKEVIMILNAFEFKDEIDLNRAKASYDRAFERISSKNEGVDIARAEASLKRALTRISIVESN